MKSRDPTTTDPTGQPRPFDRQNATESAEAASFAGETPSATHALKKRAPSTWSGTPWRWAICATAAVYADGSGWSIEWLWAFSMTISEVRGSWASSGSRKASRISSRSSVPSGRSRSWATLAPTTTAWPAASSRTMWVSAPAMISPPRGTWAISETRLAIVPELTNRPASLPSSAAARSSRALTVGSSPKTSSPTSAAAMAARIAAVGFVTVSERRSRSGIGGV